MDSISPLQYLSREQLVHLVVRLQSEISYLRNQLSDSEDRNIILQQVLPHVIEERLTQATFALKREDRFKHKGGDEPLDCPIHLSPQGVSSTQQSSAAMTVSSLNSSCDQGNQTDSRELMCSLKKKSKLLNAGHNDSNGDERSNIEGQSHGGKQTPAVSAAAERYHTDSFIPEAISSLPMTNAIRSHKRKSVPARMWNSGRKDNDLPLSKEKIIRDEPTVECIASETNSSHSYNVQSEFTHLPEKLLRQLPPSQHPTSTVHVPLSSESPVSLSLDESSETKSPLGDTHEDSDSTEEESTQESQHMGQQSVPSSPAPSLVAAAASAIEGVPTIMDGPKTPKQLAQTRPAGVPRTKLLTEAEEKDFDRVQQEVISDPLITSSRSWIAYQDASEWTRATCALMSALFSSDQMASSTVLGKSSTEPRDRLPADRVNYIVGAVSHRFGVPAAKIRTRMAQKCKDERRKRRMSTHPMNPTAYYSMLPQTNQRNV
ncbi:unnamed protein product [Calicophoron daubneyi]|uniref:BEN domain-containing protein n=1 Tax=Calicophoron daubneyi TaxID=300641 RepID=A0AAV2T9C0_CALDB